MGEANVIQQQGTRRNARRPSRPRDEVRRAILATASELFARDGYHLPSIRQIAGAAGVDLPVLYRLFDDKRDIYVQCCKSAARKQIALAQHFYEMDDPLDVTLYKLIFAGISFKLDNSIDYRLLHRVVMDGDGEVIAAETAEYRASEMFRRVMNASTQASAGHLPTTRLMLLDAFFNMMPDILGRWPAGPETDSSDPAVLAQGILSIVYPRLDWVEIARRSFPER